jgi:hypothetical protein
MPRIYLKREDLNHTGAHKINNALGQALLCKRMGKHRIIAETGAGQHGVATVSSSRGQGASRAARRGHREQQPGEQQGAGGQQQGGGGSRQQGRRAARRGHREQQRKGAAGSRTEGSKQQLKGGDNGSSRWQHRERSKDPRPP